MKDIEQIVSNPDLTRLMLQAFQSLLNGTDSMVFVKNADLVYQEANMHFVHMVGKSSLDEVVGRSDFDIFEDPQLAERYVADDHTIFNNNTDIVSVIEPLPDVSGRPRYAQTSKFILRGREGEIIGIAGISRDVTREVVAQEDYQKEISYLLSLPENLFMAVLIDVTDWNIIGERQQDVEDVSFRIHESAEILQERAYSNVVDSRCAAYTFYRDFNSKNLQHIYESGKRNIIMEYLRRFDDGEERWVRDELSFLIDPTNNHLCLILSVADINAQKKEEKDSLMAAEQDELTGILNRASITKHTKALLSSEIQTALHAMFVIDIDNFKRINDTYGHQAGDRFLVQIAQAIRKCFRDSDLVGRIGGDEFVVLMKNVPNDEIVRRKGQTLLAAIEEACHTAADLNVSGSIGVSMYPQEGKTFDQLFEKADQAMYVGKRSGKGQLLMAMDVLPAEGE